MKAFQELGRIDPKPGFLVELCCIFFIVVLRWFTSTLSTQEPLKINSAKSIHPVLIDLGGWIFIFKLSVESKLKINLTLIYC
jgi:hypothetical protein